MRNNTKFDKLAKAFQFYDKDHNGYLDKEELRSVCFEYNVPVSPEMLDELFHSVDPTGKGKVDFSTFSKFFDWRAQNVDGMVIALNVEQMI